MSSDDLNCRGEHNGSGRWANVSKDGADAVLAIYKSCAGEIFGYCLRRLYSRQLAEDAASAVFLRLVEQFSLISGKSDQEVRYWLYGTASNAVAALLRDRRRRDETLADVARARQTLGDRDTCTDRLDWPLLYHAISKLSSRQQEILVLRYFQDLETSAIAEALGMKHVAVRVQLSRAVKKLRRELERAFGQTS